MAKLATTSTTQSISKASAAVRIALIEVVVALGCTGWACLLLWSWLKSDSHTRTL